MRKDENLFVMKLKKKRIFEKKLLFFYGNLCFGFQSLEFLKFNFNEKFSKYF